MFNSNERQEVKEQIELQLHEQYATNSNSILGSMLMLFVTMLAVLGAYGYVFLHTNSSRLPDDLHPFTFADLTYTASAVTLVLTAIACLCITIGYRQRKEQFIIWSIRNKAYTTAGKSDEYEDTYKDGYKPQGKNRINAIQCPYDTFLKMSFICCLAVWISLLVKYLTYSWDETLVSFITVIVSASIFFSLSAYCLRISYQQYQNLEAAYNPKSKDNKKSQRRRVFIMLIKHKVVALFKRGSKRMSVILLGLMFGSLYSMAETSGVIFLFTDGHKVTFTFESNPIITINDEGVTVTSSDVEAVFFTFSEVLHFRFDDEEDTGIQSLQSNSVSPVFHYSNGVVTVKGLESGEGLTVFSVNGSILKKSQANSDGTSSVDLRAVFPGVYVVSTENGFSFKLLKK